MLVVFIIVIVKNSGTWNITVLNGIEYTEVL